MIIISRVFIGLTIIWCYTNMVNSKSKHLFLQNKVGKTYLYFGVFLIKKIIPLLLVGHETINANSALNASLATYYLISSKHLWNNCLLTLWLPLVTKTELPLTISVQYQAETSDKSYKKEKYQLWDFSRSDTKFSELTIRIYGDSEENYFMWSWE